MAGWEVMLWTDCLAGPSSRKSPRIHASLCVSCSSPVSTPPRSQIRRVSCSSLLRTLPGLSGLDSALASLAV